MFVKSPAVVLIIHGVLQLSGHTRFHCAREMSKTELTNNGLHILRVVWDIEQFSSPQGVVQRLLKSSEVVEDLGGHKGSKLPAPKGLILIQDLAVEAKLRVTASLFSDQNEHENQIIFSCRHYFSLVWNPRHLHFVNRSWNLSPEVIDYGVQLV